MIQYEASSRASGQLLGINDSLFEEGSPPSLKNVRAKHWKPIEGGSVAESVMSLSQQANEEQELLSRFEQWRSLIKLTLFFSIFIDGLFLILVLAKKEALDDLKVVCYPSWVLAVIYFSYSSGCILLGFLALKYVSLRTFTRAEWARYLLYAITFAALVYGLVELHTPAIEAFATSSEENGSLIHELFWLYWLNMVPFLIFGTACILYGLCLCCYILACGKETLKKLPMLRPFFKEQNLYLTTVNSEAENCSICNRPFKDEDSR